MAVRSEEDERTVNPYRELPSVEDALRMERISGLCSRVSRELLARFVAEVLERWRGEIRAGTLDAAALAARLREGALASAVTEAVCREEGRGVRRAINATGVVFWRSAERQCTRRRGRWPRRHAPAVLEVDRESGERNQRDDRLSELLHRLTGAEAAIAVNNNAAAVFLCLQTFAAGREVIVSRGELVEIGGSFRVPDVMIRAAVRLVEVGTTNRTRRSDYERAIGPQTALLMKVHRSNFKQIGFVEEMSTDELGRLGSERGLPTAYDLGSGLIEGENACALPILEGETRVKDAVVRGVDVVTFSGDKLLGGPQAGLLVGRQETIARLRANPIYRALRLDKVGIAGLEATLELLLAGRGDEIPVRAMLLRSLEDIESSARSLATALAKLPGLDTEIVPSESEPGSGSAPGAYLPTLVVRIRHRELPAHVLAARLRANSRLSRAHQDDALLFDPRAPSRRRRTVVAAMAIRA
jgi:L-seryl-tRNA(Ser) seleniumtransferase